MRGMIFSFCVFGRPLFPGSLTSNVPRELRAADPGPSIPSQQGPFPSELTDCHPVALLQPPIPPRPSLIIWILLLSVNPSASLPVISLHPAHRFRFSHGASPAHQSPLPFAVPIHDHACVTERTQKARVSRFTNAHESSPPPSNGQSFLSGRCDITCCTDTGGGDGGSFV